MQFELWCCTRQGTRASGIGNRIKENAIRKSNELPHGFSLWQEKDDGFEVL
jgi:hypothetical protein